MRRRGRDIATVSFHFLQREREVRGDQEVDPFTPAEFDRLCSNIQNQPWPDLDDEETRERVRFGTLVPFRNFERVSPRIARGTFQTSYSGHAFHNSEKGKIAAQSLNQREFQYLLYLSDRGQIFVGAQYLGNYGGYDALRWGLLRHMPSRAGVRSYSFRREVYDPRLVKAKEIRINIASATGRDDEDNVLTKKRMIVLQREGAGDEGFEDAARENFFPIMSSDAPDKKDRLIELLSDNNLMSADDEDVKNCVILAEIDGREKRLHVIGDSNFATRFPLQVPYNIDGHPEYDPTAEAIINTLRREIIASMA
jgi:hypothetical protein